MLSCSRKADDCTREGVRLDMRVGAEACSIADLQKQAISVDSSNRLQRVFASAYITSGCLHSAS